MPITTLNDLLEIDLPHESSYTVVGLIEDKLGRIPARGDRIELDQVTLVVDAVSSNMVTAVSVSLPKDASLPNLEEEL